MATFVFLELRSHVVIMPIFFNTVSKHTLHLVAYAHTWIECFMTLTQSRIHSCTTDQFWTCSLQQHHLKSGTINIYNRIYHNTVYGNEEMLIARELNLVISVGVAMNIISISRCIWARIALLKGFFNRKVDLRPITIIFSPVDRFSYSHARTHVRGIPKTIHRLVWCVYSLM